MKLLLQHQRGAEGQGSTQPSKFADYDEDDYDMPYDEDDYLLDYDDFGLVAVRSLNKSCSNRMRQRTNNGGSGTIYSAKHVRVKEAVRSKQSKKSKK